MGKKMKKNIYADRSKRYIQNPLALLAITPLKMSLYSIASSVIGLHFFLFGQLSRDLDDFTSPDKYYLCRSHCVLSICSQDSLGYSPERGKKTHKYFRQPKSKSVVHGVLQSERPDHSPPDNKQTCWSRQKHQILTTVAKIKSRHVGTFFGTMPIVLSAFMMKPP